MKLPHQPSLFDDAPAPDTSSMIALGAGKRPLTAAQRTFNRLVERIRRGRAALETWEAYLPRFQSRVASEMQPIERQFRQAQRRVVSQLDMLLGAKKPNERLSRKHRTKARAQVIEIIENILQEGPDTELEALYERHSGIPRAEQQRDEMEAAESLLEDILGADAVKGHTAQDMDELFEHASEKFAEKMRREQETRAKRGRGKRATHAAERAAQAEREAKLSVREIYRKLASALHPDRETDAAERTRKTALMQRANQAYKRNDLLELLALQIEIEQIDASTLSEAPEERVRHYNQVLLEQAHTLEAEVQELTAIFRVEYDLTARDVTPQRVDQALSASVAEARAMLENIVRVLERLEDPRQRRSVLDELPDPEDAFSAAEGMAALAAMFDALDEPVRSAPRRRKRRKR